MLEGCTPIAPPLMGSSVGRERSLPIPRISPSNNPDRQPTQNTYSPGCRLLFLRAAPRRLELKRIPIRRPLLPPSNLG